ncbi:MAG: hypothetical protein M0Z53_12040 [Thermaerobacter sp.]|nr:hypothetical protein [Thermaerobacter sp.]
MAWLSQVGQAAEERNVMNNSAYIDDLLRWGSRSTPTTVVQRGTQQEIIIGFDRFQLAHLLGLTAP